MNRELIRELEFVDILSIGLKPFKQKTIKSLIKDYGKPIPERYDKILQVYNAIKSGCRTKKEISMYLHQPYLNIPVINYSISFCGV